MGQIITTQNLVAIKEVRHAGQRKDQTSPMSKEIIPVETHLYGPPTQYLIISHAQPAVKVISRW